jgi:hypothetical protein
MADVITITPQPVRYLTSAGTGLQPIYLALDAGAYDFLDLETGVVSVEGAVTAFTLDLYTGMQTQTDDGWVQVVTLSSATTSPTWTKVNVPATTGLLRYLRWRVTTITGGTAVTFFIRGMGRAYK